MSVDPLRSEIMRAVPRTNSKPEVQVRKLLHGLGLRFRLHRHDLPGTPDIVLPRHQTIIFVHGCFWHRHWHCPKATMPKRQIEFWRDKFDRNVDRDKKNNRLLERSGWRVIIIWECETKTPRDLEKRLVRAFPPSSNRVRRTGRNR